MFPSNSGFDSKNANKNCQEFRIEVIWEQHGQPLRIIDIWQTEIFAIDNIFSEVLYIYIILYFFYTRLF